MEAYGWIYTLCGYPFDSSWIAIWEVDTPPNRIKLGDELMATIWKEVKPIGRDDLEVGDWG